MLKAFFFAFAGALWSNVTIAIQMHFFLPDDLTREQHDRVNLSLRWLTLMGAIGGLIVYFFLL
jgi:hypothetical protein